jgi:hypothetical protein
MFSDGGFNRALMRERECPYLGDELHDAPTFCGASTAAWRRED